MKREAGAPVLSAIFVDYDNIYLSLKRKSEEAAKRFSKDALGWLRGIETGRLITPTNGVLGGPNGDDTRRVVMNRCYGNPVPRRNQTDNSTDMNSFPFVRHHFLRAGFEVVDCPPLTAQMKNSADIRMVMDMRDYLTHPTYFDEFVILSGDADFTPVLQRLRQHARRTIVYANDFTAAPYTAIADGEIREADLIAMLLADRGADAGQVATLQPQSQPQILPHAAPPQQLRLEDLRQLIIAEVVAGVRASVAPVPLEALADRALRTVGHERTIGTSWAGAGSFRELLRQALPPEIRVSENPPFFAYDPARHLIQAPQAYEPAPRPIQTMATQAMPAQTMPVQTMPTQVMPTQVITHLYADDTDLLDLPAAAAVLDTRVPPPLRSAMPQPQPQQQPQPQPVALQPVAQPQQRAHPSQSFATAQPAALSTRAGQGEATFHRATSVAPPAMSQPRPDASSHVQKSIARIHEACQAPPIAPPEYRALFEVMAAEISENGLAGAQTLTAITQRAQDRGLNVRRDDVRFVLEVISEADPWFEQGSTPNLFAGRFRNYVVARCRDQGLNLSAEELDLIDAWFAGGQLPVMAARAIPPPQQPPQQHQMAQPQQPMPPQQQAYAAPEPQAASGGARANRWWASDERPAQQPQQQAATEDDFPRIVRTRRG